MITVTNFVLKIKNRTTPKVVMISYQAMTESDHNILITGDIKLIRNQVDLTYLSNKNFLLNLVQDIIKHLKTDYILTKIEIEQSVNRFQICIPTGQDLDVYIKTYELTNRVSTSIGKLDKVVITVPIIKLFRIG
mgnify:FL=1|jgi:hypothetical protein